MNVAPRLAALAGAATLAVLASCREPTAISVVLTTDVPCNVVTATHPEISVGSRAAIDDGSAQRTQSDACQSSQLGTLTVVPSGADDVVVIAVALSTRAGKDSSTCRTDPKDCILARRVLRYVSHTTLTLPIELSSSCVDKPCGTQETCVSGRCVSDTVDTTQCQGAVCGPDTLEPSDGGVDAAKDAPPDAPTVTDAGPCALTTCSGLCVDLKSDPKNCGACGSDCSGGECIGGSCRLAPKVSLADVDGDLGCVTVMSNGTAEEAFWIRAKAPAGVYRALPKGGPATTFFTPVAGNVLGDGIDSRLPLIAYDARDSNGILTLQHCDPSLAPSMCVQRVTGGPAPSPYVAMDGEQPRAAYVTSGGKILSTVIAHDKTGSYGGVIATSKGYYAAHDSSSGNALHVVEIATNIVKTFAVLQAKPVALVGDPLVARFFYSESNKISLLLPSGTSSPVYSGMTATPRLLAYRSGTTELFWVIPENGADAVYRAPASGNATPTRIHTISPAGTIACLAVGKDSIYWTQAGVAWRRPAP